MSTLNLGQNNKRRPTQMLMIFPKDSANIATRVRTKKLMDFYAVLALAVDHVALFTLAAYQNGTNLK